MNSSGMKRGLAVSAVAAMTLTGVGLTAGAANAQPFQDRATNAVGASGVALTDVTTNGTIATDAIGSAPITLSAAARSGVAKVQFSYNDGTDHNIGQPVAASPAGYFTLAWTPPNTTFNTHIAVTATAFDTNGNVVGSQTATGVLVDPHANNVSVSSTPSSVGVYENPSTHQLLGAVSGVTTDLAADPSVDIRTSAPSSLATHDDVAPAGSGSTRTFSATANFDGYVWDTHSPAVDQALIQATDGAMDTTMVNVYKQDLSDATVTASVDHDTVQTGDTATATVKVLDNKGNPVVGAIVKEIGGTQKTTNSLGEAQFPNLSGTTAGKDYSFFVDANGNGSYQGGSEFKRTVTVTEYAAEAGSLSASSTASAYDFDELPGAPAEFTATLKDTQGNPMQVSGSNRLSYNWSVTPFDTTIAPSTQATLHVATNAQGEATLQKPVGTVAGQYTLQVWEDTDGTPGPSSGDVVADPVTVSLGQATVVWEGGATHATVAEGTTHAFNGSLQLSDGTKLGNRTFDAKFTPTGGGDAVLAPQTEQPSGVTRTDNANATVTTDADGNFTIKVKDQTTTADDIGDTLEAGGTGAFAPATTLTVDFLDTAVSDISVAGNTLLAQGGHSAAIPGVPDKLGTITVENAAGDPLAGQDVTISVDHGYLTKLDSSGDPVPASDPTEGGLVGAWKDAGQSITVKTDDNGQVKGLAAAIGHDDAFATQDDVDAGLTVTAGGVDAASDATPANGPDTIDWHSDDALNPTDLTLELSVAGDQDPALTKLPDAGLPVGGSYRYVNLLASATDQFGNRVALVTNLPSISGVGGVSYFSGRTGRAGSLDTYRINNHDEPGTETVTTSIDGINAATTWHNNGTANAPAWHADDTSQPDLTASTSVNWYTVDFDNSTFALTHNTKDTVKPGTTVTETYTATDQKGAPIDDMDVNFLRSGPGNLQDGDTNWWSDTGSDGSASYIFAGTQAGTASLTAVGLDDNDNVIAESQADDTVTFKTPKAPLAKIHVKLRAKNARNGNDKLTVRTSRKAKGARVRIYKVVKGHLKKVGTAKINAKGVARKTIKEHTKAQRRHKTTYVVKVSRTAATKPATSNKKRIR